MQRNVQQEDPQSRSKIEEEDRLKPDGSVLPGQDFQQGVPRMGRQGFLQTSRPWQLGGLDHIDVAARNCATMTTHLGTRSHAFFGTRRSRVWAGRATAPRARWTPPLHPSRRRADHKCARCARQRRCGGLPEPRLMVRPGAQNCSLSCGPGTIRTQRHIHHGQSSRASHAEEHHPMEGGNLLRVR